MKLLLNDEINEINNHTIYQLFEYLKIKLIGGKRRNSIVKIYDAFLPLKQASFPCYKLCKFLKERKIKYDFVNYADYGRCIRLKDIGDSAIIKKLENPSQSQLTMKK